MGNGFVCVILHSHLPYYRKAGMWPFGEENLYEAIAETYLPLLTVLDRLASEGLMARFTIGITPILAEQLADPYLQAGFEDYAIRRTMAAARDVERFPVSDPRRELASEYRLWYASQLQAFRERFGRNVLKGFRDLQNRGAIELITSSATHGFSPLLGRDSSLHAQFHVGATTYRKHFGRKPRGIWLPECAYRPATGDRPGLEAFLDEEGLRYFVVDTHAIEGSQIAGWRPGFGPYAGLSAPAGPHVPETGLSTFRPYLLDGSSVAVVARNQRAGYQVWSAEHGYPGDPLYREFHKKDEQSGLQYWRLSGKGVDLSDKAVYDPRAALLRTRDHARHYAGMLADMLREYELHHNRQGLVAIPFDTELFGHWWFEGVEWLEQLVRALADRSDVALATVSETLEAIPPEASIRMPESTWGAGGHYWVWNNEQVSWMWPVIHERERALEELVSRFAGTTEPLLARTLAQLGRELLLLQSSDWPFLVTTGQAKDYAIERFREHQTRFDVLAGMLRDWEPHPTLSHAEPHGRGGVEVGLLQRYEDLDNPFEGLDYRHFASRQGS
ncbi:1,4-alpha-glucan branching enzyme [compost metagenome]